MVEVDILWYLSKTASSVLFSRNGRPAGPWNCPAPSSAPQWLITWWAPRRCSRSWPAPESWKGRLELCGLCGCERGRGEGSRVRLSTVFCKVEVVGSRRCITLQFLQLLRIAPLVRRMLCRLLKRFQAMHRFLGVAGSNEFYYTAPFWAPQKQKKIDIEQSFSILRRSAVVVSQVDGKITQCEQLGRRSVIISSMTSFSLLGIFLVSFSDSSKIVPSWNKCDKHSQGCIHLTRYSLCICFCSVRLPGLVCCAQ